MQKDEAKPGRGPKNWEKGVSHWRAVGSMTQPPSLVASNIDRVDLRRQRRIAVQGVHPTVKVVEVSVDLGGQQFAAKAGALGASRGIDDHRLSLAGSGLWLLRPGSRGIYRMTKRQPRLVWLLPMS